MRKLTLLTFFLISTSIFSQNFFNQKNLSVTRINLEVNNYEKDSTANALVLYESGNSYIDNTDFNLNTTIKRKIKVLNKSGVENATISIYLYNSKNSKERIKNIKGNSYNIVNGEVVNTVLEPKNIYKEKYNDNYTIVKFTLPNIKEGSVFTYSYSLVSPFIFKYKGWEFQGDIPKLYSEYNTSIPGNYHYNIKLVGALPLSENKEVLKKNCISVNGGGTADCINTTYVMENVPAFVEEGYMTTRSNYLSRIEYELKTLTQFDGTKNHYTKLWKDVDRELRTDPNIGKQLNKSVSIEDIGISIKTESDSLKIATSIYSQIQKNYTWNKEFELFKNVSLKSIIKNKSGNSAEINILLINALKEVGLNVKPLLTSTRRNGLVTKIFPVLSDFNYIIAHLKIGKKVFLLDATEKYLPFGEIPFRCLNQYGRLLDFKKGGSWVNINPEKTSNIQHKVIYSLNEEKLKIKIQSRYTGYHSFPKKQLYFSNANQYLEQFENKYVTLDLIDHKVDTKNINDSNFTESYSLESNELNIVSDNYYIDPFIFKFFSTNPFKLQERTYPIDFGYKDVYSYAFEMNFNENFEIIDIPKNIYLKLPENKGSFQINTMSSKNKVTMFLKISFNEAIYPHYFYEALKQLMDSIVDNQKKSLIVLKKKI